MTRGVSVKLTANFERNLDDIDAFLQHADAPEALDALLDELMQTLVPNLERFPAMGRRFLDRPGDSVETRSGVDDLSAELCAFEERSELREYVTTHYLLLYLHTPTTVYLLSIRHHRQLSFDLAAHWLS